MLERNGLGGRRRDVRRDYRQRIVDRQQICTRRGPAHYRIR
jgi:hypothetical protein